MFIRITLLARQERPAARLFITQKAVSKHAAGIYATLGLVPVGDGNCRVLAYLDALPCPPSQR